MALLGTGGVHGDGVLAVYMEVVPKHCCWVLAVYMEVFPKCCVVGYWRCTWRCSLSAVLLGTGGVHGGGPCPLNHCIIGYWRCTCRWALSSQVLCYWVLAVYIEVVTAPSNTVLLGTGSVYGGGVLAV